MALPGAPRMDDDEGGSGSGSGDDRDEMTMMV